MSITILSSNKSGDAYSLKKQEQRVTLNWLSDFCSEEDAKVKELLYAVEKRIPPAMVQGGGLPY